MAAFTQLCDRAVLNVIPVRHGNYRYALLVIVVSAFILVCHVATIHSKVGPGLPQDLRDLIRVLTRFNGQRSYANLSVSECVFQ